MKRPTRNFPLEALAVALLASTTTWAGYEARAGVSLILSGSGGSATGVMVPVRATSSDSAESIGCSIITAGAVGTGSSPSWMRCVARNEDQVSVSCVSSASSFIEAARAATPGAHITFSWNGMGICTGLSVSNYSRNEPGGS